MKKGTKIAVITAGLLLISAAAYALFRTPKGKEALKKLKGAIAWPEGLDSSQPTTASGEESIKPGDKDRYVEQLQTALNSIHNAVVYLNNNCGHTWPVFNKLQGSGNQLLPITGSYDQGTAAASQFYLNRTEVDIWYLKMIQDKLRAYAAGDKCKHPLSY